MSKPYDILKKRIENNLDHYPDSIRISDHENILNVKKFMTSHIEIIDALRMRSKEGKNLNMLILSYYNRLKKVENIIWNNK